MRLAGKRAFITGGRQGIGRAIVAAFLSEGAAVFTCGRGEAPDGLPCDWYCLDVSDPDAVGQVAAAVGEIDILVNNAGVQVEKTVTESSDADWDLVIGANCRGVFNCCRAFIPTIRRGGVSSISARSPGRSPIPRWRSTMHRNPLCTGSQGLLRWIMAPISDAMRYVPDGSIQVCLRPVWALQTIRSRPGGMRWPATLFAGLARRKTLPPWRSGSHRAKPGLQQVSSLSSMAA